MQLIDQPDASTATPKADSPARPLRVAMVAPPWFELPPTGYGGTESVVAALVDQLVDHGHHVALIGSGRHRTRATEFHAVVPRPPSDRLGTPIPEVRHAAGVSTILRRMNVDLVHDHSVAGPLLAHSRRPTPTVVTMHGPVDGELGDYFAALGDDVGIVAISEAQRRLNPALNWIGTVHNAVDVGSFPFRSRKEDYLLWLGRFSEEKGAHLAIDVARRAGRRLILAGKLSEPVEREYFAREVAPRLGPDIQYVGEADADRKRELLASARAVLFPIQWEEPFGMVMIEAMACGTPVVALRRGSVPEVIAHGISGMIADSIADLPFALAAAERLDPAGCRAQARARFDLPVMAAGYERLYRQVLEAGRPTDRLTRRVVPRQRATEMRAS